MTNYVRQFNFIFLLIYYISTCTQLYITTVNILLISSSFSYAAISNQDIGNSCTSNLEFYLCEFSKITW